MATTTTKMPVKIIIGILIVSAIISSCEYPCAKASSILALISYMPSQSDTIIVRRFIKATDFLSEKDSIMIDKSNANLEQQGDTLLILYSDTDGNQLITSDYDYQIYLPAANVTSTLSDITEPQKYGQKGGEKTYCINTISSYKLNGQIVKANNYGVIYIKK